MKKFLFLFILISASVFTFSSCSKDDDGGSDNIVSKWRFEQSGLIYDGEELLMPYDHECESQKDHLDIQGSGIVKQVLFDDDCDKETEEGRWERNGDTLKLTFEGVSQNWEILTLDSNTLKLKYEEDEIAGVIVFQRM